jgi:hypothetical protein
MVIEVEMQERMLAIEVQKVIVAKVAKTFAKDLTNAKSANRAIGVIYVLSPRKSREESSPISPERNDIILGVL